MLRFEDMSLAQQLAWCTWAENGDKGDLEHLALALIGEAGELAEIEKKRRFKQSARLVPTNIERLDELGDFWYYLRIASVYAERSFVNNPPLQSPWRRDVDWFRLHLNISYLVSDVCCYIEAGHKIKHSMLDELVLDVSCASESLGWNLNCLTLLNWWKLLGGRHGWPQKRLPPNSPAEIMEQLSLDTGDFEVVYQAHRLLGRLLNKKWAIYAFGEDLVSDDIS